MRFEHPFLFFISAVFFLLAGVAADKRRQSVDVASNTQYVRANLYDRVVLHLPLVCWFLVSSLLAAALAAPYIEQVATIERTLGKEAILAVDASISMGQGEHGSAMDKIKPILTQFALRRIEQGDFIGISAYSGQSNSSRGVGYSRIVQYPSMDQSVAASAIKAVSPSMFGMYSAVGDGILVAIIGLIETEAREAMGERFDRRRLENSIWSINTDDEDTTYAREVAAAIGTQKGKYIILFSDGKFNTGLDPLRALWFAERIGLRVHFISFESTGATGLSREEQQRRKEWTVQGVLRSGGTYKESNDVDGVADLLNEIDKAEKAEILIEQHPAKKSRRMAFTGTAFLVVVIWSLNMLMRSDPL